jgi:hypothetical protein
MEAVAVALVGVDHRAAMAKSPEAKIHIAVEARRAPLTGIATRQRRSVLRSAGICSSMATFCLASFCRETQYSL